MIRVKICGITAAADARAAAAAGADAVGMICRAPSQRTVDEQQVAEIAAAMPSFVMPVLLFAQAERETIESFCRAAPAAMLQFHGSEDADFCASFGRPYVHATHPMQPGDVAAAAAGHPHAAALLLDGSAGGSGEAFDWSAVPPRSHRTNEVIVAGGLNPANVAAAVAATDPYGVDVSTGVCRAGDPRRKDPALLEQFVAAARSAHG